ncbi:MAG: 5-formyltetrahydrofolate cyclo-ligase [Betaproteobacteria bacterium]|nr:5-formyltetrahydrofolate cyclo-ligase [Betaproteobacteria bacterium]
MTGAAAAVAPAGDKAQIRAVVLARRDALPDADRHEHGRLILEKVVALDSYRRSPVVMAYASFGSELDTGPFLRAVLASGKTLVLPKVDRARGCLETYAVADMETDLVAGPWGLREPDPRRGRPVSPEAIGFVLVPGVAFDRRGGRIGYGKGFYDRLLAACRRTRPAAWAVAAAFDLQLVGTVPMERHDLFMDGILTESRSLLLRA